MTNPKNKGKASAKAEKPKEEELEAGSTALAGAEESAAAAEEPAEEGTTSNEAPDADLDDAIAEKEERIAALDAESQRLDDAIAEKTVELAGLNEKLIAAGKPPVKEEPKTVQGNLVLKKNSIFLNGRSIAKENFNEEHFAELVEVYGGDEDKAIEEMMVEVK